MGTIIQGTAVAWDESAGSIELAARAGIRCLEKSGVDKEDVDLLVSVGVYRDENIVEPAIVHLIQTEMGLNLDPMRSESGKGSFAFDLMNGECGSLNAIQVADAILKGGSNPDMLGDERLALLVSGDVHPSKKDVKGFPYSRLGGAILLRYDGESSSGFGPFGYRTGFDGPGARGGIDTEAMGSNGREKIDLDMEEDFKSRCHKFAVETVGQFLEDESVSPDDIHYLVSSQHDEEFANKLASSLGIHHAVGSASHYETYGDTHTSSLAAGFHELESRDRIKKGNKVLFTSVGSGLTCACALYEV